MLYFYVFPLEFKIKEEQGEERISTFYNRKREYLKSNSKLTTIEYKPLIITGIKLFTFTLSGEYEYG